MASMLSSLRAAWRPVRAARFHVVDRRRHDALVLERVCGTPIIVLPGVFNPALLRTGAFLAELLGPRIVPPGSRVLDLGTGSGVLAVTAAEWAGRVVAVDVNPEAVRCAGINARLNRVEHKVELRHGDLFAPVAGERFDLVLCNPPYFRAEPRNDLERAWRSTDMPERLAAGLPAALAAGGKALVLLSTDGAWRDFLAAFAANGLRATPFARRDLISEVLTVYQVERP